MLKLNGGRKMKTNILTVIITAVVGIILLGGLLLPIIDSPGVTKDKVVGTNDGAVYYMGTNYESGLELEISNGLITNGEQFTPTENPGLYLFSDKFSTLWWKSATYADVSDVDLGVVKNVVKITINSDGSYSYTKSDDSVENSTGTISKIFYPTTAGSFAYYTSAVNIDMADKWYSSANTLGSAPWYFLMLNMEGNNTTIDVPQSYVATSASASFVEAETTVEYDEAPAVSADGLSYIISNTETTRVITYDGDDYTKSGVQAPIIAPTEYHYYQEKPVESSLFGVIPVLIIVAILMGIVGEIVIKRNE